MEESRIKPVRILRADINVPCKEYFLRDYYLLVDRHGGHWIPEDFTTNFRVLTEDLMDSRYWQFIPNPCDILEVQYRLPLGRRVTK